MSLIAMDNFHFENGWSDTSPVVDALENAACLILIGTLLQATCSLLGLAVVAASAVYYVISRARWAWRQVCSGRLLLHLRPLLGLDDDDDDDDGGGLGLVLERGLAALVRCVDAFEWIVETCADDLLADLFSLVDPAAEKWERIRAEHGREVELFVRRLEEERKLDTTTATPVRVGSSTPSPGLVPRTGVRAMEDTSTPTSLGSLSDDDSYDHLSDIDVE